MQSTFTDLSYLKKSMMYVAFEGIDGSGKSTALQGTKDWLEKNGYKVLAVKEFWYQSIRDAILSGEMPVRSQILLAFADRIALIENVIKPALEERCIVLCDRSYLSTLAYQGYGMGYLNEVRQLINDYLPMEPNWVFWFDCPVETALKRISPEDWIEKYV